MVWLQSKSMCSHVSASCELHMGHVLEEKLCMPKISCFLAFSIYWHVLNLSMLVFCSSVIVWLFQKSLDVLLFVMGFIVHLWMLGKSSAIISRLFLRSYFLMYSCRHLTGPLSDLC